MSQLNRREFIKTALLGTAATMGAVFTSSKAFAAKCTDAVAQSKAFRYVPDFAAALKAKKFTDKELNFANRANPKKLKKASEMNCANCSFYGQNKAKPEECTMIPGCTVKKNGWCIIWSGKA